MTSIIISSDVTAICPEVGEKIASAMNLELLGPSVLSKIAQKHQVPESELKRVLEPNSYHRVSAKKRSRLLALIQNATLERLTEKGVVCVGLGAHLYVRDVSHVLMINMLHGTKHRAKAMSTAGNVSEQRATKLIQKEDELRSRWSVDCFGLDETDPSHYDMVINIERLEHKQLVEIVKDMAGYRKFQPMSYSTLCLNHLLIASRIKTIVLPEYPNAQIEFDGERAIISVGALWGKQKIVESVKEMVGKVDGVGLVEVYVEKRLSWPLNRVSR
ncbi:MAG: hypothetical protein HN348_18395 [Proteobacteria bacterium]|jgi:cytidylate kinase|nr:hypothetical protein [Pseudomonadota bacterium]